MNNITIINKKQKKKLLKQNSCTTKKILDNIFADQHNSNIKKLNKVNII